MVQPELNNQRRVFLGWNTPPIESLTRWLTSKYTRGPNLDLSDVIIVLPAAAAVKSLLARLIDHCQAEHLLFFPPTAVTLGHLPEYLYTTRPTASPSLQALLWTDVARKASLNNSLERVFPTAPRYEEFGPWHVIGETLATLHTELAGDLQNFQSVVEYCEQAGHAGEVVRWQQLADLQRAYLDEVDRLGFWDIQTARLIAVKQSECSTDKSIIVAGCVDINQTIQGMLKDVVDKLTILTFAPESESDKFQENGALMTDAWQEHAVDLSLHQLTTVDSPNAQALSCANIVAELAATGSTQQDFVIACPDANDEPYILRLFDRQSTPVNPLRGRSLRDNIVITTLRLLGEYVQTNNYQSFASLLRLPDIQQYLIENGVVGDLISLSDDFHEKHLPRHSLRLRGLKGKYESLSAALQTLDLLVLPLSSGTPRLSNWCNAISKTLNGVYGQRLVEVNNPEDSATLCGTRAIAQALGDLADADRSFKMECTVNECIDLTLELAAKQFENIRRGAGITITGWLDVVWGDQANVLITGFNEGTIPSSITSDPFLPNSLRASLGLVDNARRFARDAYTTTLLINSRTAVTFFSKRTDASGMPLWPSRIALTGSALQIAQTLIEFSAGSSKCLPISAVYDVASIPSSAINIPFSKENRTEFTVTEFKDYLSCPKRYYLKHILKISSMTDHSRELSAMAFGDLLHDTLNDFGMSEFNRSKDESVIYKYLESQLQANVDHIYGEYSYGIIPIQISQLQNRLLAFSRWQAAWISEGWEMVETEFNCNPGVPISADHPNFVVRGRIDRIDYHANSSSWAIFDYKSSESSHRPEQVHNCSNAPYWKDLQLPLYRHLAKTITGNGKTSLGYINISNDLKTIGGYFADWDSEQLKAADLVALDVMKSINSNHFEMNNNTTPMFFSEYSYLLGDTALDHPTHSIEREPSK
jgi:ATP-dependent helicase/nuclease subunit B